MANGVKTTLSVREMGKILGLKKVESYYLVRKGYFETIIVEGKMRVVRSSFEAWYANQDRYRKIEGEPPGKKLRETSWSAKDAAEHLAISIDLMYTIIRRDRLKTILIDGVNRIPRDEFDKWYGKQDRYRNPADRARDAEMEAASMTMPEMARLLNISRGDVYRIIREDKGRIFQMITIAGKKRILLDSFEKWYAGQNKYSKLGAQPGKRAYRQGRKAYAHCLNRKTSEETLKRVPFSKEKKAGTELLVPETSENMQPGQPDASTEEQLFLTPGDAAVIAGCTPSTIRRWVQSGKITAVYLPSGRIYIAQSELEWFLSVNCPAGNERDSDEAKSDHTRRKGVQSHGVSGKTRQ